MIIQNTEMVLCPAGDDADLCVSLFFTEIPSPGHTIDKSRLFLRGRKGTYKINANLISESYEIKTFLYSCAHNCRGVCGGNSIPTTIVDTIKRSGGKRDRVEWGGW